MLDISRLTNEQAAAEASALDESFCTTMVSLTGPRGEKGGRADHSCNIVESTQAAGRDVKAHLGNDLPLSIAFWLIGREEVGLFCALCELEARMMEQWMVQPSLASRSHLVPHLRQAADQASSR